MASTQSAASPKKCIDAPLAIDWPISAGTIIATSILVDRVLQLVQAIRIQLRDHFGRRAIWISSLNS